MCVWWHRRGITNLSSREGSSTFWVKVCFTSGAPSDVLRPVPVKGISLICSATPTLGASLAQWSWDCIHHSAFPWGHLDGSLAPFAFQELFFLYHGKNLTKSQFKSMSFSGGYTLTWQTSHGLSNFYSLSSKCRWRTSNIEILAPLYLGAYSSWTGLKCCRLRSHVLFLCRI